MKSLLAKLLLISVAFSAQAENLVEKNQDTGRLYWADTKEDAFFFGVNYIVGFNGVYKYCKENNIDIKEVIDNDVYHLSRMGINAFRIHVWDSEISDPEGNLKDNEHLNLLDYLIYKLESKGIYVMLTPIYYGGNFSYMQNPDMGFSVNYPKVDMHTDKRALKAHKNYIKQFANHVNAYTKKAYKDDNMIVAYEVCNEPWEKTGEDAAKFAKEMREEIRSTGCTKPIFYNSTTVREKAYDILKTDIDGATFQWYPSGLRQSRTLKGNHLPLVDKYTIPFANEDFFQNKTKAIYEFDAPDINESYMYSAMAISFKEAGFQWATMFSYDPLAVADSNTSYFTHYMSLPYTPSKAIGLMIATELFTNPKYYRDRENEAFQFQLKDATIDYKNQRYEISDGEKLYYTADTNLKPNTTENLKRIAGCGSSPIVKYDGYGAYFIDKISDDLWRLEVMPDAIQIRDPHSNPLSTNKKVAIKYNKHQMTINIENLGKDFNIVGVNDGNNYKSKAKNSKFIILPGAYLLSTSQIDDSMKNMKIANGLVKEFNAPKSDKKIFELVHTPVDKALENKDLPIEIKIVSDKAPKAVKIITQPSYYKGLAPKSKLSVDMKKLDYYTWTAKIPAELLEAGSLKYAFALKLEDGSTIIMPNRENERISLTPDYFKIGTYSTDIIKAKNPIQIFYAGDINDTNFFYQNPNYAFKIEETGIVGEAKMVFEKRPSFARKEPAGSQTKIVMQKYIGDLISNLYISNKDYNSLKISGKSLSDKDVTIDIALIDNIGQAFKKSVKITPTGEDIAIDLKDLSKDKMFLLPRPYPLFLDFWYDSKTKNIDLDLSQIERIEIIIPDKDNEQMPNFELKSIILQ